MRWTLVTETYPPEINGVAMTLGRLVATMARQGHCVSIVRPLQKADRRQRREAAEAPAVPLPQQPLQLQEPQSSPPQTDYVLGLPIPGYPGLLVGRMAARRLRKIWTRNRPDVVHIATEGPLGFSALRAARQLGIPVVSTFHTNFHSYGKHYRLGVFQRPLIGYLRWFHNRTLATFVPSADLIDQLRAQGLERLCLMGRGVDTRLFGPHRRSEALRRSWGVAVADAGGFGSSARCGAGTATHAPVVLYVGRLAAEKNLPLAIAAFERLRARLPEARMVIVGDGPLREKLQREHPQIHFAGMQRGEALAACYASADLFFFASVTETFGNVVTEAMASGLVVLAYDYAAPGRYIRNGENGFTVPFDNSAAYLDAADQLAGCVERWQGIGVAAAASVQALSWDAIIAAYAQQVEQVIAQGAGREGALAGC